MLRTLYLKTVRDRWLAAVIAAGSLFLIAWMGLAAYSGLGSDGTDFVSAMPPAYLALFGIAPDTGTAGLMLSSMFNFIGPFVIAGLAVSMGAVAIAGEEASGTMNLLATVPHSRSRLLRSKAAAILTITLGISVLSLVLYRAAIAITGADAGSLNLAAATVHLAAVAVLYGAFALAIGCWTGNRALASAVSVASIVVSFFGAGLLPLFDGWASGAKVFPWYYIGGSQPLANGVDWAQVAGVLAVAVALFAVALWGVNRRDLQSGEGRAPLLERLRSDPRLARVAGLLAGNGSSRGIASKAFTDLRALLTIASVGVISMGLVMGPLFTVIPASLQEVVASMPEAILAMVGFADYSTATGWYYGEFLSILAPVAVAVVAISGGVALAREEADRTIGVLLGTPTSRTRVAWGKALGLVLGALAVGFATIVGISLGNLVGSLGMDYGRIAATGLLLAGLGMVLGAAAFLGAAATGRTQFALGTGIGVAVLGWGANSFLPVNPDLANWAKASPFYYVLGENPLDAGMNWAHLGLLAGGAAVLVSIGMMTYRRRDLRG